jgi:hypothetical protein
MAGPDTIQVFVPLKVRKKNGRPKILPPADYLVKFHGIDLPTLPAAARREKWQDFTPPAARLSRHYRGLILHRRFQKIFEI